MLIDTHCHLDDPVLAQRLPGVLSGAAAAGVAACIIPGVSPAHWQRILDVATLHCAAIPRPFPALGVHPMHADLLDDASLARLDELAPSLCAIGEIGLDHLLETPSREVQRDAFLAQLRVARRRDLPVLIHCRKAFADLLDLLRREGPPIRGVMHGYSGSVEIARECVKLGLHVSLCGTVTYANAVKPLAVASEIPLSRLLLETDAPDLSPEPHRGEVNLPERLALVAARVAEVKGVTPEEVAAATTASAVELFRLSSQLPVTP